MAKKKYKQSKVSKTYKEKAKSRKELKSIQGGAAASFEDFDKEAAFEEEMESPEER